MEKREKHKVVLLLGSNKGNRIEYLRKAKRLLFKEFGTEPIVSRIIETEAIGFSGHKFLNQVLLFKTQKDPFTILNKTQEIEKILGRKHKSKNGIYINRIIDIDILFYDDWVLKSPFLQIPHPQVLHRPFVSVLLEDILSEK